MGAIALLLAGWNSTAKQPVPRASWRTLVLVHSDIINTYARPDKGVIGSLRIATRWVDCNPNMSVHRCTHSVERPLPLEQRLTQKVVLVSHWLWDQLAYPARVGPIIALSLGTWRFDRGSARAQRRPGRMRRLIEPDRLADSLADSRNAANDRRWRPAAEPAGVCAQACSAGAIADRAPQNGFGAPRRARGR